MAAVIVAFFDFPASIPNYNRINEWPLQFLRTGYYDRAYGSLAARTTYGYWWSDTASSVAYVRHLGTFTGGVNAQNNGWCGDGFALRGVAEIELVIAIQVEVKNNRGMYALRWL